MENYIEGMIFEASACKAMLDLVGRTEFNWVAGRVRALDDKVDGKGIDAEAINDLDGFFPIFDIGLALDYLYKYAVVGNDQELKEWVEKQKKVRESRNKS